MFSMGSMVFRMDVRKGIMSNIVRREFVIEVLLLVFIFFVFFVF